MSSENDKIAAALTGVVQNALLSKSLGQDATPYRQLVSHISSVRTVVCGPHKDKAAAERHQLVLLLQACARHVSYIRPDLHASLVAEILAVHMWVCGEEVLTAVLEFIVKLLVANGNMVTFCLKRLIFCLIPPNALLEAPASGQQWEPSSQQAAVQDQLIKALADILLLVPTAPKALLAELSQRMPFKITNRATPCMYFRAVYGLSQTPAGDCIRDGLQGAMVDCLLNIDVEIKWQDIADQQADNAEDERGSDEEQDVFALEGKTGQELQEQATQTLDEAAADPNISRGGWEGAAATQDTMPVASTSEPSVVDATADSLDSLMEQTFDHLVWRCNAGQLQRAWGVLLTAFERTLLHTYRSKFTQFLVYYLCQQNDSCTASLIDLLLKRIHDPNRPAITRTACAAYLSSFLARAKFVPKALLVKSLLSMAQWCVSYCKTLDHRHAAPLQSTNPFELGVRHQVFYAMCQGLLYALCYHLENLLLPQSDSEVNFEAAQLQHVHISSQMQTDASKDQVSRQQEGMSPAQLRQQLADLLPTILRHRLGPLTVCAPSVAQQFLKQAQDLSLMDCTGLGTSNTSLHHQVRPLEMFFPFDPYLLRRSARFLSLGDSYNTWGGSHRGYSAASHESSDDELEVLDSVTAASDSSSDNDDDEEEAAAYDAEMQNGQPTPLLQSWGNRNFAKPLGIAARFQNSHKLGGQPQSYDSQDHLTEDSSRGSSPKMIIGSVEPVPMSC